MKQKLFRLTVPMHAAFLLGASMISAADTAHVNMLSRNIPDIAYTLSNFAAWDGWTKAYALTALGFMLGAILLGFLRKKPLDSCFAAVLTIAAGLIGTGIAVLWSAASDHVRFAAIVIELVFMIARWTWLPHTLGWCVLWFYLIRDRKQREAWGHSSQL